MALAHHLGGIQRLIGSTGSPDDVSGRAVKQQVEVKKQTYFSNLFKIMSEMLHIYKLSLNSFSFLSSPFTDHGQYHGPTTAYELSQQRRQRARRVEEWRRGEHDARRNGSIVITDG